MVRSAIVEDEEQSRRTLQNFLLRYQQERGCEFRISVFTDGE